MIRSQSRFPDKNCFDYILDIFVGFRRSHRYRGGFVFQGCRENGSSTSKQQSPEVLILFIGVLLKVDSF